MKKPPLRVFSGMQRSGSLLRSDLEEDMTLFLYERESPPEYSVSLTMPVRTDPYDSMAGLLPIFDMNLPEGALRERLRMQFAKTVPEFDDLDLLGIVGASQIGRLRFSLREELDLRVPTQHLAEILNYQGSADLFTHLLEQFAKYSGISGVQPKVLIRDGGLPAKLAHQGATHIVKAFDAREYPELATNEMICMTGAAAAGIRTAQVRLSDNRQFLVVDRFDRVADRCLGIEDFCVLNARRAHGRYDGSYENIAKRITDFVSGGCVAQAREQFVRMVAYACAIENGDAHLKNFSVLYADPESPVELAPAYDLVCTSLYLAREKLALSLGNSKEFPDRARLSTFIRQVTSKSQRAAGAVIDQAIVGAQSAIVMAKRYGKQHSDAKPFAEKLCAIISRGIARIARKK